MGLLEIFYAVKINDEATTHGNTSDPHLDDAIVYSVSKAEIINTT